MPSTILDRLRRMYNPDLRAMAIVFVGASFTLMMFLSNRDFTNPYYNVGLAATVFSIVSSVVTIAYERRANR